MKIQDADGDVRNAKTLRISAKCSDLFDATLHDDDDVQLGIDYSGYVPPFFPDNGGDYVALDIDVDTGVIRNWPKIKPEDLETIFIDGKDINEDENEDTF